MARPPAAEARMLPGVVTGGQRQAPLPRRPTEDLCVEAAGPQPARLRRRGVCHRSSFVRPTSLLESGTRAGLAISCFGGRYY